MGISQPAVSAAIKKIENSLGSPVFDRDRRPIQLTTAGRLLWNRSFLILEQLDDLTRSIQFSLENEKPDLRLGASDCMSACVCPPLIDYLLNETENISACTGSTPKVTDLLKHRAGRYRTFFRFYRRRSSLPGFTLLDRTIPLCLAKEPY